MQTQSFHSQTPLFQGFPLPKRKHKEELWVSSRTEEPVFGAETPSQMLPISFGEGDKGGEDKSIASTPEIYTTSATHKSFIIGQKRYEISNHLGNVSSVITDRKFGVPLSSTDPTINYYLADIVTATDYDPYGQVLPGRVWNRSGYRFGFNGQELDSELGEVWSAEFWEYDASLGRRWDIDPIDYPFQSPYATFDGNPIAFSDPLGLAATGDGDGKDANGNVTKGNDPKVTKKDIKGLKKLEKAIKKLSTFEGTPNATSGGVEIHGGKRGSNHSIWKNRLRTGQPAVLDDDRIDYKLWYERWQYNRREANKYQFQPSAGDVFSTLATAAAVYFTLETMGLGPAAVELLLDQTGIPNPKDVVNIVKGLFRLGKTGFNFARKWLGQWELDRVATFKNLSCNIPILKFKKVVVKGKKGGKEIDNEIKEIIEGRGKRQTEEDGVTPATFKNRTNSKVERDWEGADEFRVDVKGGGNTYRILRKKIGETEDGSPIYKYGWTATHYRNEKNGEYQIHDFVPE